jgi:hypothetical protein
MNTVTLYLVNEELYRPVLLAQIKGSPTKGYSELMDLYNDNYLNWESVGSFYTELEGEEAAEYAFDLSNNPRMEVERMLIQGKTRSLSVGDVVEIMVEADDGFQIWTKLMCMPEGWREV